MVEEGKDIPYIEHWHREPLGETPLWAARLEDRETGQKGAIARMGSLFMFARERYCDTPAGLSLAECVAGAIDMTRAQEFLDELTGGCVLDLGKVDYISSAGLGVLLRTHKRLMGDGQGLKLVNVHNHINDIFMYSGFDKLFEIEIAESP